MGQQTHKQTPSVNCDHAKRDLCIKWSQVLGFRVLQRILKKKKKKKKKNCYQTKNQSGKMFFQKIKFSKI